MAYGVSNQKPFIITKAIFGFSSRAKLMQIMIIIMKWLQRNFYCLRRNDQVICPKKFIIIF